jgi:threonyl-tRNA synthetase
MDRAFNGTQPTESPIHRVVIARDCDRAWLRPPHRAARAECDPAYASLGARIRRAHGRRVPYVAVIGDSEAASGLLAVRLRDGRRLPGISAAGLIAEITRQVACRSAGLGFGAEMQRDLAAGMV